MNTTPDGYFTDGCGRCPLYATPQCKVHKWPQALAQLRRIVLDCGLKEEAKWGVPCYTFQRHNILIISAFNDCCSISFFKGALLNDPESILELPGQNSQAARVIRFTQVQQVLALEERIRQFVFEAIEVEKAGLKVVFKKPEEYPFPEELQQKMAEFPALQAAFGALTPGRQRGYLLHFSAAKQAKTRVARIEKCMPLILAGKGLMD